MAPRVLNFITGNANKLREVKEILSITNVQLQSQNVDVPELQGSIEEISTAKCRAAADIVRLGDQCGLRLGYELICVENRSKDPY